YATSVSVSVATTSGSASVSYTYNTAVPSISAVSPNSGTAAGGDTITITGSNFTGANTVTFGTVMATSFTVLSDNTIVAVTPALPSGTGTVDIRVNAPGGLSSTGSSDHFTYNWVTASAPTVTALSVTSGSVMGGAT